MSQRHTSIALVRRGGEKPPVELKKWTTMGGNAEDALMTDELLDRSFTARFQHIYLLGKACQ